MKPRPLPPKPIWYEYARQVREELDNVKPNKSGKREGRLILFSWKTAVSEKCYPGSERDWEILLRRLGRLSENQEHRRSGDFL